jgi:hypothetical protein
MRTAGLAGDPFRCGPLTGNQEPGRAPGPALKRP